MTRLDNPLQHAVEVWRTQLQHTENASDSAVAQIRHSRVNVLVDFTGPLEALQAAGLDTGYDTGGRVQGSISFTDLDTLDAVPGVELIRLVPDARPLLDSTVAETRTPWKVSPGTLPGRGGGVIVAVIDTGIDIYHESFRKDDAGKTTRILELWDQDNTVTGGDPPPTGFAQVGRVFSQTAINNALTTGGAQIASKDTNGHGTHVAGIAAGNGQQDDRCSFPGHYVGVAPEADLVIVKSIGVDSARIRDAMLWCAQAGTRHAVGGTPKPVVINCSFGSTWGPHDGNDVDDLNVQDTLRPAGGAPPPGLAIVAAAGNEGDSEIHDSGTIPKNEMKQLYFYMPKGSVKADVVDIWYNGDASLTVEVIAPPSTLAGTRSTGAIAAGVGSVTRPIGRMNVSVRSTVPLGDHDNMREIRITISTPTATPPLAIRPDVWELKLTETAGIAANWNAWTNTSHTDPYPTFRLPGQPATERRRVNTLDSPGTARDAITVASYDDDGGKLADFSSRGLPDQLPFAVGEMKPTVAAPGVAVAAPRGKDNPDKNSICCDQKVIDLSGTSMAAPHVAGLVALMLQRNPTLTFIDIRRILQQTARIDGIPNAEVPPVVEINTGIRSNHLWGSGKIDGAKAVQAVPVPAGGGGGGGPIPFADIGFGYTPHDLPSRIGYVQRRFGNRPSLMLIAALLSEHIDEILGLVNGNRRVLVVWRRGGGPSLVRRLLNGPMPDDVLVPSAIPDCDVAELIPRFITVLQQFGGARLRADLDRFRDFLLAWPGADLTQLDRTALAYGAPS